MQPGTLQIFKKAPRRGQFARFSRDFPGVKLVTDSKCSLFTGLQITLPATWGFFFIFHLCGCGYEICNMIMSCLYYCVVILDISFFFSLFIYQVYILVARYYEVNIYIISPEIFLSCCLSFVLFFWLLLARKFSQMSKGYKRAHFWVEKKITQK